MFKLQSPSPTIAKSGLATLLFVLATAFTPPQYLGQNLPENPAPTASQTGLTTAFQGGEEMTFKIYYNLNFVWIPAGEVVFKVEDEGARYHFSAIGRTYDSYEWFYKAYNKVDSYVDKASMLPQTSLRYVKENRYKVYDKVQYDQDKKTIKFERGDDYNDIKLRSSKELTDQVHDMLSAVYYCRMKDYTNAQIGSEFPMKVLLDEETYSLKYRLTGREEKSIKGLGKFSTLKFTPQLVAGNVFDEKSQMKIWATDDGNKLPLMIESPVAVGTVKVVLKSWKNLKHGMTAKKG
jgi:Protein of unknown function (DUF3108)